LISAAVKIIVMNLNSDPSVSRATLSLLGFAGVLFLLSFRQISDPDIWFYLVQGREIVASSRIPLTEFYIFPAQGEPATFSAIGFGVLYFLVHQIGGFFAMAAFNAALATSAIFMLLMAAQNREPASNRIETSIIVGLLVYLLAEFRFVYRPENLLFVFLGTEIFILEAWLKDRISLRLLWLPPMVAVLSLFHTSAVLLLIVFACYLAQYIFELARNRHTSKARELWFVLGIVLLLIAVPWLNPNGWEQFLVILRSLINFNSDLVEYLPALKTEYRWHFIFTLILAMAALFFAPVQRIADWLLIAAFAAVAWIYARNIGLFAMMIAVPLSRALHHAVHRHGQFFTTFRLRWIAGILGIYALAGLIAAERWGYGVAAETVFSRAAVMIRQMSTGGNVMNFFHHGGYLAWELGPSYKVAVDGHFVRSSFASEYHDRVMRADNDWKSLLSRYDVKFILTPATLPYSGEFVPLAQELARQDKWVLVNTEPAGLMFARSDIAQSWRPIEKREIWMQAIRELDLLLDTYPQNHAARAARAEAKRRSAEN
jgi:hypothetical protein